MTIGRRYSPSHARDVAARKASKLTTAQIFDWLDGGQGYAVVERVARAVLGNAYARAESAARVADAFFYAIGCAPSDDSKRDGRACIGRAVAPLPSSHPLRARVSAALARMAGQE